MNGTEPVSQQKPEDPPAARSGVAGKVIRALLSIALAVVILVVILPKAIGSTVHDVGHAITHVSILDFALLCALWFAGLVTHSFVLTGSLPGLSTRRALTLNLTGSAVANLLPFGGAVGMSLNYYMLRAWRMSLTEFSSFTVVSNVWNVLMKLSMPAIALLYAMETGVVVSRRMTVTVIIAVALLTVAVIAIVSALASPALTVRFAALLARAIGWIARIFRRTVDRPAIEAEIIRTRHMVAAVVRIKWFHLSLWMTGYGVSQAVLLYFCLDAVGAKVDPAAVLAAYSVERFLSLFPFTPGGFGIAEAGTIGTLVAMGGNPTLSAAGVILYRAFVAALEVPVGGVWLGSWYYLHWRKRGDQAAAPLTDSGAA